ncbi:hypothetical protein BH09SUM1_BH09SUM1_00870 [soil metagenome]
MLDEIARLGKLQSLNACIADCNTRAASLFSTQLSAKHVSGAVITRFEDELKRLGADRLPVAQQPQGSQRGEFSHKLGLKGANVGQPLDILSEGESRAVALAGFLTDLATSPQKATLVFDDPVSSLDHGWREKTAVRLVEEAQVRQVVIFTHDLYFAYVVAQTAGERSVPHSARTVFRNSKSAGLVAGDGDWNAMPTKDRVSFLKSHQVAAALLETSGDVEQYRKEVLLFYDRLRSAWERYVEECLLNGVVLRFGKSVQTGRLKKVASDLKTKDFEDVERAMTRCSEQTAAHDMAPQAQRPTPDPTDLATDLKFLEDTFTAMKKRR